ncbi:HPP-domain-containing protein [Auricularia subglabra TFB-10046 SS5]|nr:HPP-domain-containing protein [Auricularia subglabra TFB-10046 SS5]
MALRAHILARWPALASRWLGFRAVPPKPQHRAVIWAWSFIGAFVGMSVLQAVFGHTAYFKERHAPPIIASFAASAVLCYGAIEAPFSQPRSLIGGHFLSALLGVCIHKLFALLPAARYDEVRWLSASLSCAVALVAMMITGTTHPPAGATAMLATTEDSVVELGWYYLPVVLLSSVLVLCVALLNNNAQRRYPVFWWKPAVAIPAPPEPALGGPEPDERKSTDPLRSIEQRQSASSSGSERSNYDRKADEKV